MSENSQTFLRKNVKLKITENNKVTFFDGGSKMKLYTNLKIKNIELKNRIIIEPIVSKSGDSNGFPSDKSIEIYEKYANSGAGMVIMEQLAVHSWGRNSMGQFRLYNDENALALRILTKIFENKDIPVVAQLNFSGAGASDKSLIKEKDFRLLSPSGLRNPRDLIQMDSKMISINEIEEIVKAFGNAAKRAINLAKFSGGVQIYACHGYLIGQFLSPITNKRTDEYGGDLNSRAKILFEIVKEVKNVIGDFPLSVRLGASDQMPGREEKGLKLSESIEIAKKLVELGVDWIGVSGNHCIYGIGENDEDTAYFASYSHAIYESVKNKNIPVDCAGGIRTSKKSEELLQDGVCELIGIARPILKNENFLKTF